MSSTALRQLAAALAIAALFLPSLASAGPIPREAGAGLRIADPGILQWIRSFLARPKNGSQLDPDGSTATPKNGSQLDPSGGAGREENGPGLDPSGAAGLNENGPGLDPNGRS